MTLYDEYGTFDAIISFHLNIRLLPAPPPPLPFARSKVMQSAKFCLTPPIASVSVSLKLFGRLLQCAVPRASSRAAGKIIVIVW